MRQIFGKIEATRHKVRGQAVDRKQGRQKPHRSEAEVSVFSRFTGAAVRALLVMLLIATPSMMLSGVAADTKQMVALIALFFGALTFVEYFAVFPSLIEFRHAPPFNRIRWLSIFITVFLISLIQRGHSEPSDVSQILEIMGRIVGEAIDFPFSPVRLVVLTVADGMTAPQIETVRTAAGISYLVSLVMLTIFVIIIRAGHWPARGSSFNVWLNLPTFDPTAGRDVVYRLDRDARVNIALGFLLPFLMPAVVQAATSGVAPVALDNPQVMIWTMAAWSFLPASLFMRGIAMGRVADMIREQRRISAELAGDEDLARA